MSYLKYDHSPLENCHEVPGFFSHCNSDLDRLATIFLIQGHRLKRRSCHFILRRMSPLKQQQFQWHFCQSQLIKTKYGSSNLYFCFCFFLAHLPNIEQVTFLVLNQVRVENEVAVSSVEVSVPWRIHRDQLQILNPPHLKGFTVESDAECGFEGF